MPEEKTPLVLMKNISKSFPGVTANKNVTFELSAGEIHALLGENGAGKSTLMSILAGLYRPDSGEIYVQGQRVTVNSPKDAIKLGIGMVYQHFKLINSLTVTENIILGLDGLKFILDMKDQEKKIEEISRQYNLKVDPLAKIWQLSVGEQQRVEIIKTLYRQSKILILDEPTAVLTPGEAKELFLTLQRIAKEGCGIIFISHKLDEVLEVCNKITVLRNGEVIGTLKKTPKTCKEELIKMMVGEEISLSVEKKAVSIGRTVLQADKLTALNDLGQNALLDVSFSVNEGEIFGVAGVAGNGQRELAEVLSGLRKTTSGAVFIKDEGLTNKAPICFIERGVSYIPADRLGVGLAGNLDLKDNVVLKDYRKPPYSRYLFLAVKTIVKKVMELVKSFQIKIVSHSHPVRVLSGGNLQKVVLARELMSSPCLIIAVHPSRGLDIGAAKFIRQNLLAEREKGTAILLISEDLEELFSLSDRLAVMYEGKIIDIIPTKSAKLQEIGFLMAGSKVR